MLWDKIRARGWQLAAVGAATLAIGALVAAALSQADARHWRKLADDRLEAVTAERTSHAVTKASLEAVKSSLAIKNAESLERAAAFEASKRQAEKDVAAADARWKATADQVARLKAIAARPATSGCEAPAELLAALEGL